MVGNVKYIVRLSTAEREALEGLVNKGKVAAAKRQRAHLLLKADASAEGPAWSDEQIAEALEVSVATIHRTRQAYVAQGLEVALERQRPTGRQCRKLDGAQEAKLAAIACSPPPEGQARWTLKLLADQMVTLEIVEAIGKETVRRTLKKMTSSRGCKNNGSYRRRAMLASSARWKTCWRCIRGPMMPSARSSVSTRRASRWSPT
jgi:transposase